MDFIDHLRRCNTWRPDIFRRFVVAGTPLGWVRDDFVAYLTRFPGLFTVNAESVVLADRLATLESRTAALHDFCRGMVADGLLPRLHDEDFAIAARWGEPPLLHLDRHVVPAFGVRAYGVHVNGYVEDGDRQSLWIGRRAADKLVEPGKLDNMVAGGLPVGIGVLENVIKEAAEEADLPATIAGKAKAAGAITYCFDDVLGLKCDTMFVFDLALPAGLTPRNTDGEIVDFMLMDIDAVAAQVRSGFDYKFNVALIIIDFLIRHGRLTPENQPDYLDLVHGLRARLP
jgi:hypothetical protein